MKINDKLCVTNDKFLTQGNASDKSLTQGNAFSSVDERARTGSISKSRLEGKKKIVKILGVDVCTDELCARCAGERVIGKPFYRATKKRVQKKYIPPDMQAFKLILEAESGKWGIKREETFEQKIESMSESELRREIENLARTIFD